MFTDIFDISVPFPHRIAPCDGDTVLIAANAGDKDGPVEHAIDNVAVTLDTVINENLLGAFIKR